MKQVQLLLTFDLEDSSIVDKHNVVDLYNSVYDALSNNYVFSSKEKLDVKLVTDIDILIGKDKWK